MGILFGTDGIRGVAGLPPLDRDTIYRIGYCLGGYLKALDQSPHILIGRDTRISGPWIETILDRAIRDAGGVAENCGVISTPAVSYLTTWTNKQAGIVISASHNPFQDNGIKIFSNSGMKFNDDVEETLEKEIISHTRPVPGDVPQFGAAAEPAARGTVPEFCRPYTNHLRQCISGEVRLNGMQLVVDCAHGAVSEYAPGFLSSLGAEVHSINCNPNGRNINLDAGALHVEHLRREVLARKASLGIAFDGDADRAMFVDRNGVVRDGDDILYLMARCMPLGDAPRIVVGTVMANLGLEVALEQLGFTLVRTTVGDRYVLEEMLRRGAVIGGEQSGHIILTKMARTGDGLLTAVKVLEILREQQRDIADLCGPLTRFPQILLNVKVREKVPFSDIPGLADAEVACKESLGTRSRILLRYSGTEKLARVMVEGEDDDKVKHAAESLAALFERIG